MIYEGTSEVSQPGVRSARTRADHARAVERDREQDRNSALRTGPQVARKPSCLRMLFV